VRSSLAAWPAPSAPDAVIRVGEAARNAGIERLAARRSLGDAERLDVLVRVANGGTAREERELVVAADGGAAQRFPLALAPGEAVLRMVTVPSGTSVRATLSPGDALALDDAVSLDLRPLRRRAVAVSPSCPAVLVAAFAAHPALARARDADRAEAIVACGEEPVPDSRAALLVRTGRIPSPAGPGVTGPLANEAAFDATRLRAAGTVEAGPGDRILLAADAGTLAADRAGSPARVETTLDFATAPAASPAALPLLVAGLAEALFREPLLDAVATAGGGKGAARVTPSPDATAASTPATRATPGTARALDRWLLAFAALVLVAELALLALAARRDEREREASPAGEAAP